MFEIVKVENRSIMFMKHVTRLHTKKKDCLEKSNVLLILEIWKPLMRVVSQASRCWDGFEGWKRVEEDGLNFSR